MGNDRHLNLLILTYGEWLHASSRIRALNYIRFLENTGKWKVTWLSRAPDPSQALLNKLLFPFIKRISLIKQIFILLFSRWDIIFAQRIFLSSWILRLIKLRNIPLVYDFDDALYLTSEKSKFKTVKMVSCANTVIVSNQELLDYCKNYNNKVFFIPSPVDGDRIKAKKRTQNNTTTIGWIGSPWTEKYLNIISPCMKELSMDGVFKLLLVGASKNKGLEDIEVIRVPWNIGTEAELLNQMDIGIMPLEDDEWSKSKGGYKIFQYMAGGIPVVASPIGINSAIVEHGETGFLAKNASEWIKYLMLLGRDRELRNKMGIAARQKFEKEYSYQQWFSPFEEILLTATEEKP